MTFDKYTMTTITHAATSPLYITFFSMLCKSDCLRCHALNSKCTLCRLNRCSPVFVSRKGSCLDLVCRVCVCDGVVTSALSLLPLAKMYCVQPNGIMHTASKSQMKRHTRFKHRWITLRSHLALLRAHAHTKQTENQEKWLAIGRNYPHFQIDTDILDVFILFFFCSRGRIRTSTRQCLMG